MRGLVERVRYAHTEDGQRLAVTELSHARQREDNAGAGEVPPALLVHGFAQNRLAFTLGALGEALWVIARTRKERLRRPIHPRNGSIQTR